MRPRSTSLRTALALLILLATLPLLAALARTNLEQRQHAIGDARLHLVRLVTLIASNQKRLTEGTGQLLPVLARAPEVAATDGATCDTYLAQLLTRYPWYANFGVADLRGQVVCSAVALERPVNIGDRPYFARALERDDLAAGGYQIGRITRRPTLNYGYPLHDRAGAVRGVLFAALDLAWLNQIAAQDLGLPSGTTLTVFDESGTILARYPDPALWVGRTVESAQVVQATLRMGAEGTAVTTGPDGVRRFYAIAPLHGPEQSARTFVAVGVPDVAIYGEVNRALAVNLAAWGVVAVLAFALAGRFAHRRVVRPVNTLVDATRRLRAGDLSTRVEAAAFHADEFGHLADSFNETASALERRRTEDAVKTARLQALWEVSQVISAAQSVAAVGAEALRHIRRLLPVARASVALFDPDGQVSEVVWVEPDDSGPLRPGARISFQSLRAASPDLVDLRPGDVRRFDLAALPDLPFLRGAREAGLRDFHVVPLAVEGAVIGSLSLWETSDHALQPDGLHIAEEVANLLAVGMQQARLREALRRHAADLEVRVAQRTVELQDARRDAERANRAKSEFLSRMSHELRTPLNAVLGFGQLLQMDDLDPSRGEHVHHIVRAGRHLLDLINEVLDIARIEAGAIALSPEPVALRDAAREAVHLIRPLALEWGVTLGDGLPPACDGSVLADRQRLKQILLNLLSNAVKYNRRGGAVDVVCAPPTPGRIRVGIRDTGPGIAPELIDRLFVPFDRIGAEHTPVEGTGLGLPLSRRLAEAMQGTITVDSEVGVGSTFWLDLPEAPSPVVPVHAPVRPAPAPGAESDGERRVILYVEDNLSNLQLVEAILARRPGVALLTTVEGRMGLHLALEHRPDAIFLDLHLPDLSGVEVLSRIRAEPELRGVPVIVLSADATAGQAERVMHAGATAYMAKPIDVPRFLEVLDAALAARPAAHARRSRAT